MKLYILLALIFTVVMFLVYMRYQKEHDTKQLLRYAAAVVAVVFFTYVSKIILVHKPLFIIHLASLFLSWFALLQYLVKKQLNWWFLMAPALTTLFFVIEALFFREHG